MIKMQKVRKFVTHSHQKNVIGNPFDFQHHTIERTMERKIEKKCSPNTMKMMEKNGVFFFKRLYVRKLICDKRKEKKKRNAEAKLWKN